MLRGMTARPDGPAGAPGPDPAPVNVVVGEEELLVERSVSALIAAARQTLATGVGLAAGAGLVAGAGQAGPATERARATQPPRRETSRMWRPPVSPWAS